MKRRQFLGGLALLAPGAASAAKASAGTDFASVLARWDADEHHDLKGVVIRARGHLVAERYFNGEQPETLHDIRSAGKSVTSLLVGAARDRGLIHRVADPVQRYWPRSKGSAVGDVRITDLLTMRSGLAANDEDPASPGNEDRLDEAPDSQAFLLATPRLVQPGTHYQYNSLTAFAAGLMVEKASGERMIEFARGALFGPLGIDHFTWASDASGHTKGQGNLSLTTRDLSRIGQMVLQRGRYEGRRVLSPSWIDESLRPHVAIGDADPYADGYGYFWYARTHDINGTRVDVRFASGNGGNKIYVVPALDLVVAITSSAYGRGYGQKRSEAILKALLAQRLA